MNYLTLFGIFIGVILTSMYMYYKFKRKEEIQLSDIALLLLSSSGAIAGIKVIIFAFNPDLLILVKKEDVDITHVFLGGVTMLWASILSAVEVLKKTIADTISAKVKATKSQQEVKNISDNQPTVISTQTQGIVQTSTPIASSSTNLNEDNS